MRERNETELDPHFPVRFEPESPEAVIELDVPKDGLGFDGTSAVVDLDGPPVGSALVALSPERASLAVDGPVHGHVRPVAEVWTSRTSF